MKNAIKNLVKKRSNPLLSMSSSEAIHFLEKRMNYIHSQVYKESLDAGADTMLTIEEAKNYINKELADVNKNGKEEK